MNLARHSLDSAPPTSLHSVTFTQDQRHFISLDEDGYSIWRTNPLRLIRRRELDGTLANVFPLPNTALLVLQGGGNSPLYPPNKVVIYHDSLTSLPPPQSRPNSIPPGDEKIPDLDQGTVTDNTLGRPIASLEFRSRIRGLAARDGSLFVVLVDSVVWFEYGMGGDGGSTRANKFGDRKGKGRERERSDGEGFWIRRRESWRTCENEKGLIAVSTEPGSTLLAIPGRQHGHVQLIRLHLCPITSTSDFQPHSDMVPNSPTPTSSFHSPILVTHTHPLSHLSTTPSGSTLVTASTQGTLLRMWDVESGRLERELRRGLGGADVWGVKFGRSARSGWMKENTRGQVEEYATRKDERSLVMGWSDKGTIHVWTDPSIDNPASPSDPESQTTATIPKPKKTRVQRLSSLLDPHIPLPRYFRSQPSSALFRLSREMSPAGNGNHAHEFRSTSKEAAAMNKDGDDFALTERFVVAWVDVVEEEEPIVGRVPRRDSISREPKLSRVNSGRGKATRSRVPPRASGTVAETLHDRGQVGPPGANQTRDRSVKSGASPGSNIPRGAVSLQMIAITLAGDWYRIGLPPTDVGDGRDGRFSGETRGFDSTKESDPDVRTDRCVLLEYRRLRTSVDGW